MSEAVLSCRPRTPREPVRDRSAGTLFSTPQSTSARRPPNLSPKGISFAVRWPTSRLTDAIETGWYRSALPANHFQALSDERADRDLASEGRQLSQLYNHFDRLNHRMDGRRWSNGPIPEQTTPDVRDGDDLAEIVSSIDDALGTLERLRVRFRDAVPSRPQTYDDLARRYATYGELSDSGQTWGDVAKARVPLYRDVGAEIVAMIDEIRTDAFTEPDYRPIPVGLSLPPLIIGSQAKIAARARDCHAIGG